MSKLGRRIAEKWSCVGTARATPRSDSIWEHQTVSKHNMSGRKALWELVALETDHTLL